MIDPVLGIMQGRLLNKYKGNYQAHPVDYWQNEFSIVKNIGLSTIEFIIDYHLWEENPLITKSGQKEIIKKSIEHNISVNTICADIFMDVPFFSSINKIQKLAVDILEKLLESTAFLKISDIIIPCVDKSSLNTNNRINRFVGVLKDLDPVIRKYDVNLCLETDLSPRKFSKLLNLIGSEKISVNYDTGNSASLGYNPIEEFSAYGELITDIHIKDRPLDGPSVFLGKGDVNFQLIFDLVEKFNYKGPLIFQVLRDDDGIEIFQKQFNFFKKKLEKYNAKT